VILTEDSLRLAVNYFLTRDSFSFDVESSGDYRDQPHLASISWISLATYGCCIVIPLDHPIGTKVIGTKKVPMKYKTGKKIGETYFKAVPEYEGPPEQLDLALVFGILAPLFSHPKIVKTGHDVIYDLVVVSKYLGFVPVPPYFDTKIAFWTLNENRMRNGLKEWTEERYDHKYDFENVGKCAESHPFDTVAYYSYCDSKFDWLHYKWLKQQIADQGLQKIYDLEMNILNVLIGMRLSGVRIDVEKLKQLRADLRVEVVQLEGNIYAAAGKKFNINSNPQKQQILFGKKSEGNQGLKPWKLTAKGREIKDANGKLELIHYSTDDEVLASYPDNPLAHAMREYGDVSKILSTYVESWLGTEDEPAKIYDGRIHAGFLQYGTVTGRFSCRSPNLQNLPRSSSDMGKMIRDVFISEPGGKLVVADYSQIELVILAHYIGEGKLYEAFMQGIDPHTMTAAMVLGKDPADVSKVERQDLGKTLGFAVVYGAGLGKVASMAHITFDEAKRVLKTHERMFPEIHQFKQDVLDLARSRQPVPYITTLMGRKRRVPDLNMEDTYFNRKYIMGAERQTFNSLIQGGAADLIKLAMVRLDATLPDEAKLVLSVHDELAITAPDGMVFEVENTVREAMTGAGIQKLVRVPLRIDLHTGDRWGDIK